MDLILCGTKTYHTPGHKVGQPCPQCGTALKKQRQQNCCCVWWIPVFPISKSQKTLKCTKCGWGPVATQ